MSKTNSKLEKKESNLSEDSSHKDIPGKQRALVLQGGGALGAYEVRRIERYYVRIYPRRQEKGKKTDHCLMLLRVHR